MAYQPPAPTPLPYQQVSAAKVARAGASGCQWIGLNLLFVLFLAIGGWYGWRSYSLFSAGGQADGTVVEMDSSTDEDGTAYAPIIDYMVDGQHFQMKGSNYSNPPAYHVGQNVTILYDRDNPSLARINNFWELWLLPAIFLPLAVLAALLYNGFVLFGVIRRMTNRGT